MIWPFVTKQTEPAKAQSAPIAFSTADLELAAVAERAVAAFVDYLGADTMPHLIVSNATL